MELLIVRFYHKKKPKLGILVTRIDENSLLVYSEHCLYLCSSMDKFRENGGKLQELRNNNPDIQIVTIDNSGNRNREVSVEEAFDWDYEINQDIINQIDDLFYDNGKITRETKQRIYGDSRYSRRQSRECENAMEQDAGGRETLGGRASTKIWRSLGQRMGLDLHAEDAGRLRQMLESVQTFLDNFGITLNDVQNYRGEMPLFDALKIIRNIVEVGRENMEGVNAAADYVTFDSPNQIKSATDNIGLFCARCSKISLFA